MLMFSKLWNDEAGFVTLEYLLGATILVLGMIVGLSSLRRAITSELSELAVCPYSHSRNKPYGFRASPEPRFHSCPDCGLNRRAARPQSELTIFLE